MILKLIQVNEGMLTDFELRNRHSTKGVARVPTQRVESLSIHLTVGRIDYTTRYAEDLDGPTVVILKDEDTYGMMIERRSEGGWLRKFRYFELRKQDGQVIYLYRAERENGRQIFFVFNGNKKIAELEREPPGNSKAVYTVYADDDTALADALLLFFFMYGRYAAGKFSGVPRFVQILRHKTSADFVRAMEREKVDLEGG